MTEPLPPATLAWLREAAHAGQGEPEALLHLLEARPACADSAQVPPTSEAAIRVALERAVLNERIKLFRRITAIAAELEGAGR